MRRGSSEFAKFRKVPEHSTPKERTKLDSISAEFPDLLVNPVQEGGAKHDKAAEAFYVHETLTADFREDFRGAVWKSRPATSQSDPSAAAGPSHG
jgi:hypothetical protein